MVRVRLFCLRSGAEAVDDEIPGGDDRIHGGAHVERGGDEGAVYWISGYDEDCLG